MCKYMYTLCKCTCKLDFVENFSAQCRSHYEETKSFLSVLVHVLVQVQVHACI